MTVRMVLDRLPPTLAVSLNPGVQPLTRTAISRGVFRMLTVKYVGNGHNQVKEYRVVGCILRVNYNHFVARWKAKGDLGSGVVEHDSIKGAAVS
jgi:hypothetical protein